MNTEITLEEWLKLPDKIDMIPNEETAQIFRTEFMLLEKRRCKQSLEPKHRYLANAVNYVFAKYNNK